MFAIRQRHRDADEFHRTRAHFSTKTPDEIESALSEARSAGKRTVLLRLKSGGSTRFVTVPAG